MPDFSTLIKPASSLCNLRCRYCFYADESSVRSVPSFGIMTKETAHLIIDRAFEFTQSGNVSFAFQGGEPTFAGIGFFKDFTEYADSVKPAGVHIGYCIQTNGMLIDGEWCALLKKYNFLVGLSIDGAEETNNFCRIDASGKGCFKRVMESARLLTKYGVDFNILTVVTKQVAAHPKQLWNFYYKNNFDFVQLIPCLAPLEEPDGKFDFTLTPRDFSTFLTAFFNLWAEALAKGDYISVRHFDNLVKMAMGERPEMCGMLGTCSAQFVIEADGSVYPCDFFALDKYNCGNIRNLSFREMGEGEVVKAFLMESFQKPSACGKCKFFGICRGGCRRYRSFYTYEKDFCPYAAFLEGSFKKISDIAAILKTKKENI